MVLFIIWNYRFKNIFLISLSFLRRYLIIIQAILVIFMFAFVFSFYYIKEEIYYTNFLVVLSIFVFSIILLCLSNRFFIIFTAWDGLGISSFILIIHYENWKRLNSRVFTLLRNRIGDVIFLVLFGFLGWMAGETNKILFISWGLLLIIFISITKRAQAPISAWLPAAIAAPTPVSALVHSSTLVTAGVVVLLKFHFLFNIIPLQFLLLCVGLLTIFVAGFTATIETDFKKLVAISTLRQIGILFTILGTGIKWFCIFHLLTHAFFKSCLFLCVGSTLHFLFSAQDKRNYCIRSTIRLKDSFIISICFLCLCGLFFTRGFFSKDLFLDYIIRKNIKILVCLIYVFRLFFTFFYSWKIFSSLINLAKGSRIFYIKRSIIIDIRTYFLFFMSLCYGYWVFNNFLFFQFFFISEKFIFLIIILFLVLSVFIRILSSFFSRRILLLDQLPKTLFFEKLKIFSFQEKKIDYLMSLVFFFSPSLVFLNKSSVGGFILLICLFFGLILL